MKPTAEDYEKSRRLSALMDGFCDVEAQNGTAPVKFVVRTYDENVNLGTLLKICDAMECKPEELFFNADTRDEGGCETCHSTYPVLELWVVRGTEGR